MIIINSDMSKIITEIIKEEIEKGKEVSLSNFGIFYPKPCQCCGHHEIAFKYSSSWKEKMNK